jgi:hypothetical protein
MEYVIAKLSVFFGAAGCSHTFFFLPSWWEFLPPGQQPKLPTCAIPSFDFPNDLILVGLAVLDMLLRIGGFAAVISLIIAGVQYITSGGSTDKGVAARKRVTNSLIGLAIVLIAAATVQFIGKAVGGS